MKSCGIYEWVNILTGKRYVGSSKNIEKRKKEHFQKLDKGIHPNTYLQNAWDQDRDDFSFTILKTCAQDDLLEWEQFYVDLYGADRLYNVALDIERPSVGLIFSEEARRKISEANKSRKCTEETRRKLSAAKSNLTEETRRKLSVARKGKTHSQETRRKISEAVSNPTEETRHKMSAAKSNPTEEARRKMSAAQKGKTVTEETRRKMSVAHKARKKMDNLT